jgi:hypothetical protein
MAQNTIEQKLNRLLAGTESSRLREVMEILAELAGDVEGLSSEFHALKKKVGIASVESQVR